MSFVFFGRIRIRSVERKTPPIPELSIVALRQTWEQRFSQLGKLLA